jgi:hypothetical protein
VSEAPKKRKKPWKHDRVLRSEQDKQSLIRYLQTQTLPYPCKVRLAEGEESRSEKQNRLQFRWYKDAEVQGDQTAQEYRALCKLHFGVPILRMEEDDFRQRYDRLIRPMPYEQKLELMAEPFDLPITSIMNVQQMSQYLDRMWNHFTVNRGMLLTDPSQYGLESYGQYREATA